MSESYEIFFICAIFAQNVNNFASWTMLLRQNLKYAKETGNSCLEKMFRSIMCVFDTNFSKNDIEGQKNDQNQVNLSENDYKKITCYLFDLEELENQDKTKKIKENLEFVKKLPDEILKHLLIKIKISEYEIEIYSLRAQQTVNKKTYTTKEKKKIQKRIRQLENLISKNEKILGELNELFENVKNVFDKKNFEPDSIEDLNQEKNPLLDKSEKNPNNDKKILLNLEQINPFDFQKQLKETSV